MSGRGGGRARGGRGRGGRGRGRGRGQHYAGSKKAAKAGLCSALGSNVFDYGHKAIADQMRTSWEKLVQYVGTNYAQDISNELQNKLTVTVPEPVHTDDVIARHALREQMVRAGQDNLQQARLAQRAIIEAAIVRDPTADPEAPMKLAVLDNAIAEAQFAQSIDVPIEMTDSEKTQYNNAWRTYRERNASLAKHRGQAYSPILGQCTQLLQDRMKQDTEWTNVSTFFDPLTLHRLIDKTTLAQTENQYPFATVYDQASGFVFIPTRRTVVQPTMVWKIQH